MPRGRKPKPGRVKLIEGNPGHRPIEPDIPAHGLPQPPAWLSAEQVEAFYDTLALVPGELVGQADSSLITRYIIHTEELKAATQRLAEEGLTVVNQNGATVRNPLLMVRAKASELMGRIEAELGMTPSSRARLGNVRSRYAGPDEEFMEFLCGTPGTRYGNMKDVTKPGDRKH
jgi:P27 family predicted phage terminase small subunit